MLGAQKSLFARPIERRSVKSPVEGGAAEPRLAAKLSGPELFITGVPKARITQKELCYLYELIYFQDDGATGKICLR